MPELTTANAKLTRQLTFEGAWPSAIAFLDNDRLAVGNLDGQLLVWDLRDEPVELSDEEKKRSNRADRKPNIHPRLALVGHTNSITRMLTAEGGKTLVSAGFDRTIRLWEPAQTPTGETHVVIDGEFRKALTRYDKSREKEILEGPGAQVATLGPSGGLEGHADWVFGLSLSADGTRLLSGDDRNESILWDFPARKELRRWTGHPMCGVVSTAVSADAKKAFVAEFRMRRGDFDRPPAQAKLLSLDAAEPLLDLLAIQFPDVKLRDNSYGYGVTWAPWVGNGFITAAFSPDGSLLAVGQGGEIQTGKVHLIDVATGKTARTISGHESGVTELKFTADGKHVVSAGRDTLLRVCRVEDGTEVAVLGTPRGGQFKDWLSAFDISPDQTRFAAADIAGLTHVWEFRG